MNPTEFNRAAILENLEKALKERNILATRAIYDDLHVADAADLLESLSAENGLIFLRFLPKTEAANLFAYLSRQHQQDLIQAFAPEEMTDLIATLDIDDATDLLEELPANLVQSILAASSAEKRASLNRFLLYKKDSAGSIMSENFIALQQDLNVAEAIRLMRHQSYVKAALSNIYVIKFDKTLVGVLSIREILQARDSERLADIMQEHVVSVTTDTDQEEVVKIFGHYDFLSLPVLDSEKRLVGIVSIDDALDISAEEATEDFEIMAAMQPNETSYFETSILTQAKNRLPWLLLLLISGMFNGLILGGFENAFVTMPILVTFIPMLTDTGGNAGSQSSTIVIRSLAMGEIEVKQLLKVLWTELRISFLVGLGLAFFCLLRIYFFAPHDLLTAFVVALAVFCIVVISKLCGACLPLLAKCVGLDPALMAAPLITTIVDAGGLIIFFSLAKLFFHI